MIFFTETLIQKRPNLPDLTLLQPTAKRWREIGIALNVKEQVLNDFENYPGLVKEGPEGFLRETLSTVEDLTVERLAKALRSVQEESTAQALEEHYLTGKG